MFVHSYHHVNAPSVQPCEGTEMDEWITWAESLWTESDREGEGERAGEKERKSTRR